MALENALHAACSNEAWGASEVVLSELARATFSPADAKTVMAFVWKQLQLGGAHWRAVHKTLHVLDHLVRNGSARVVEEARAHLRELEALSQMFEYVEPDGKDMGADVRAKAKQMLEVISDVQKLGLQMCVMRPRCEELFPKLPFLLPSPAARCREMGPAARVLAASDLVRPPPSSDPHVTAAGKGGMDARLRRAADSHGAQIGHVPPRALQQSSDDTTNDAAASAVGVPTSQLELLRLLLLSDGGSLSVPVEVFDATLADVLRHDVSERAAAQAALVHAAQLHPGLRRRDARGDRASHVS